MLLDSWPYYFLGALKKSLEFEQIYIITFHFAVYNARRFTHYSMGGFSLYPPREYACNMFITWAGYRITPGPSARSLKQQPPVKP